MKKYLFLLFTVFSTALIAQFEDLAKVSLNVEATGRNVYKVDFILDLKEGAYTYGASDALLAPPPFEVFFDSSSVYEVKSDWKYPKFKTKFSEEFEGDISYYEGEKFVVSAEVFSEEPDFTVGVNYQGQVCEKGRCIPTQYPNPKLTFDVGKGGGLINKQENNSMVEQPTVEGSAQNDCEYDFSKAQNIKKIESDKDESYFETFIIAFLFGLGALLTPCVFPMIPMTVSFFLKGSDSKVKGKMAAIVFGVSIIVIYCLIGTLFSVAFNVDTANLIATHWIPNLFFFSIFLFFAASFFGMFEIRLLSSWGNSADQKADRGGIAGAIFMALTLSLVSFSCTGPIIGTVLVESVKVGGIEPLIGMLGFSSAFALPFTLFAFFPQWLKNLPKSGGWLNSVKVVFGFLELALALKFLSIADLTQHWGILDREVFIALWIVIFTLLGFYLLGKLKFSHDSDLPYIKVPRFLLAIITFSFVVYLLPGMWGAPLRSLSGYLPPLSTMDFNFNRGDSQLKNELCTKPSFSDKLHLPHGLVGYFDYEEGMCCAKEQEKPVFIDFTGHGCANCREIENNIWSDPEILELLNNEFVIISLYVDEHTIEIKKPYVSVFDGKTQIKTVGQKAADIQKTWFGGLSQPYYVTMGNEEELLEPPISYTEAQYKADFLKFLKTSLLNYKRTKN